MNKTAIKNFAVWARQKLISESIYKAGLVGITEKEILSPLPQSQSDIQFFDIGTNVPVEVRGGDISKRNALATKITEKAKETDYKTAFEFVIEEVAYTWFNRLIAIRFMEVNDYLPSGIRVLSSETADKNEPDIVTNPFDTDVDFSDKEKELIWQLKDENKLDELFRFLFIKQCNKLNEVLPNLFEKTNNYTELLLSISFTDTDGVLRHLVNDISEEDFGEAVEIIGWLYQYYNSEPKDKVFANLKKNIKISKENIPAATQLFTPDWIVRYMVENSLGKIYIDWRKNQGVFADGRGLDEMTLQEVENKRICNEKHIAEEMGWKYYLPEAEQTEEVKNQLAIINGDKKDFKLEELKVIDPCMGSGHILVYAFDVLMQIYESQGYTSRDAVVSIMENNLFGLDIDERAYQLSYFALMMKARASDRRFLTREIAPQVYCPKGYADGEEYGSLLNVEKLEDMPQMPEIITFDNMNYEQDLNTWNFRRLLNQKYDVVVTNPPYMGSKGMSAKLSKYVQDNYADSKSDMFASFIERGNEMTNKNGYNCMVTMQSWMFLSSFEKMREKIILTKTITNLMHMENMVMGIAFGTAVAIIQNSNIKSYKGTYNHITMKDIGDNDEPTTFPVMQNRFAQVSTENFSKIPGSPIAYWVSEKLLLAYENNNLDKLAQPRHGLATSDNARFLKVWFEVNINKCSVIEKCDFTKKWYPMNKGGSFRKWYGNLDWVINYEDDGKEIKDFAISIYKCSTRTIQNTKFYFQKSLTWSALTSGSFSVRWSDVGALFGSGGYCAFVSDELEFYILALMNSKINSVFMSAVSPTLNYEVGHIKTMPVIQNTTFKIEVDKLVDKNISLSKTDWDSFETSWDFVRHPLVQLLHGVTKQSGEHIAFIEDAFNEWTSDCESQFNQLKTNEEELNRIFIEIYGLQDELTPEVEDKDVTVRLADKTRDIKSFISYAVGCMFGRYSLDVDGLAYAGGNFNDTYWLHKGQAALNEKGEPIDGGYAGISISPYNYARLKDSDKWETATYLQFSPDYDNCLPITDEEYFSDDIVGRFVDFVKVVYGDETIEQNLDFIASALPNKGNTSREVIRNYFLKDFYKDHVKTYQKRPIYWLYDSGKQDGFKALVYMHRYNADTTGLLRVDYLHKIQRTYENEIEHMKDNIDNNHDIAASTKRMEKLVKQLQETKEYDEKIAHLALSRIAIDLDDGVKVNYEKVQTGQDGKKLDVLGKI